MSATTGHGPAAAGGGHSSGHGTTPSSPTGTGYLYMIPILFVVFIVFRYLFFAGDSKNNNGNNANNSSQQMAQPSRYTKTIIVNYGPEYSKTTYLPGGFLFFFDDATEPYCCSSSQNEACGEADQDVSQGLGDSRSNTGLKFKSSNGSHGVIKIVLTQK